MTTVRALSEGPQTSTACFYLESGLYMGVHPGSDILTEKVRTTMTSLRTRVKQKLGLRTMSYHNPDKVYRTLTPFESEKFLMMGQLRSGRGFTRHETTTPAVYHLGSKTSLHPKCPKHVNNTCVGATISMGLLWAMWSPRVSSL